MLPRHRRNGGASVLKTLAIVVLVAPLAACKSDTGGNGGDWFGVSGSYYEGPGGGYGYGNGWNGLPHRPFPMSRDAFDYHSVNRNPNLGPNGW